jgi:hypothetical protein
MQWVGFFRTDGKRRAALSVPYQSSKVVSDAEDALTGAPRWPTCTSTTQGMGSGSMTRPCATCQSAVRCCAALAHVRRPATASRPSTAVLRQGRGCLPAVVADVRLGHATPDPGTVLYLAVGGSGWRRVASASKAVEGPTRRQTKRRPPCPRAYGGADGAPGRLTSPFVSCLSSALAQRWVG